LPETNGSVTYCFDEAKIAAFSGNCTGTWTLFMSDARGQLEGGTGNITNITITTCAPQNLWSPTTAMNDAKSLSPQVCPTETTTYTISITDSNGCTITDQIEVIVGPCTLLSNELVRLSAEYKSGVGIIRWQTTDDVNSDHYIVEKSQDGVNYSYLSRVKATGRSGMSSYVANDISPARGINYYKLSAINANGEIIYTETTVLNAKGSQSVEVIPNPASDVADVLFDTDYSSATEIKVYDVTGRVVIEKNHQSSKGNNRVPLDVKDLNSGLYTVVLTIDDQRQVTRFLKQK
jgi:hypothetical protein